MAMFSAPPDDDTRRLMALRGGVETKAEHLTDLARRHKPWTVADYEAVRQAAIAVVRSYRMAPVPGVDRATVDGPSVWALIGALDRTGRG